MDIKILTLEEAKNGIENLNKKQNWSSKFHFFEKKFNDKILPIISHYIRTPKVYKQKNIISTLIFDHFYDDFHYKATLLELMCFIRDENYWSYSYDVINKILENNEYSSLYSRKLLDSQALDNIGVTFPIFYTGNQNFYNDILSNKEIFRTHIENSSQIFGNFNLNFDSSDIEKKLKKVQAIFDKKFLSKEILEIFLYAECYHNDRIYNVVLKDIEESLNKLGYNSKWREAICKYSVYLLTISIQDSYEASKKLIAFSNQNVIKKISYSINKDFLLPQLTIN